MKSAAHEAPGGPRRALRERLLAERAAFVAGAAAAGAASALARRLLAVLSELEPDSLGVYWPHRAEFNAVAALTGDSPFATLPIALPYAQRTPVQMHYRAWDREPPALTDECGIPASSGAPTVPEVVLVPCVGFTPAGHRLGYGGGYFDRWLALHPHVTAIGIAWAVGQIEVAAFDPQPHDRALTLVVTEHGVN